MNLKSFSLLRSFANRGLLFLLLISVGILLTNCSSNSDEASDEAESTETMVETEDQSQSQTQAQPQTRTTPRTVTVITKRPELKRRHTTRAKTVEAQPEQYTETKPENVVVAKTRKSKKPVYFVPHRTTYMPVTEVEKIEDIEPEEVEIEEVHRMLTQFDTPPKYGFETCQNKRHPEHCMHIQLQRYFSANIDRSVFPGDGQDHVEFATFVVQANGEIDPTSIQVVDQDPHCEPCAVEARRLIREMPAWEPGVWNGEKVATKITLPIRFHEFTI